MPDLRTIQGAVGDWSHKNFGDQPSFLPLLGVVEEVGELAHAELKGRQGIRHTPVEIRAKKEDAIGDILIYLMDYCNREGIDIDQALHDTWHRVVRKRNWAENPLDADKK